MKARKRAALYLRKRKYPNPKRRVVPVPQAIPITLLISGLLESGKKNLMKKGMNIMNNHYGHSKYMPHQGKKESAKRSAW